MRRCLAESPLTEEGNREVGETVFRALLDAAGPTGSIQVAFRIFPEHVEVDVLHSDNQIQPLGAAPNGTRSGLATERTAESTMTTTPVTDPGAPRTAPDTSVAGAAAAAPGELAGMVPLGTPGHPDTFADWMSTALRREGKEVVLWSTRRSTSVAYGAGLAGPDRITIEWLEEIASGAGAAEPGR